MGLFDFYDDPEQAARLAFGAGLLSMGGPSLRPISTGQAIAGGLMASQQAGSEAAMNKRRNMLTDIQLQNAQQQAAEFARAQQQRAMIEEAQRAATLNPAGAAMLGNGGPTVKAGAQLEANPNGGGFNPALFIQGLQNNPSIDPLTAMQYQKAFAPPPPMKVSKDERVYGQDKAGNYKELIGPAPERPDPNKPFMVINGQVVPNPAYQDYELRKAREGSTRVNTVVNAEKPFINELAGNVGKSLDAQREAATAASRTITTAQRLRQAVDSGVISGPTANARISLAQVGQVLGINGKDDQEKLLNTRKAVQALAQLELDAAQQMKGQGQITEAEREIIRRAASGNIDLTAPELTLLAQTLEKTARTRIGGYQKQLERLGQVPSAAPLVPFMSVDAPGEYQSPAASSIGSMQTVDDLVNKYRSR